MKDDTRVLAPAGSLECGTVFESENAKYFKAAGPAPEGEINVMRIHREEGLPGITPVVVLCKAADYVVGFEAGYVGQTASLKDVQSGWVVRMMNGVGEAVVVTRRFELGSRVCVRLLGGGRFPANLRVEVLCGICDYRD